MVQGRSGFSTKKILKHVKPEEYQCRWKPVLTHLQINPDDLDSQFNFDYRTPGLPEVLKRGGYPYYLSLGWYRHALKVLDKYEAFHGTRSTVVRSIAKHGRLPSTTNEDAMLDEAFEQIGEEANHAELYVATHCEDGSYPQYTVPFTVMTFPDMTERFSTVFQCHVKPGKFTTHKSPVSVAKA
ncbi:unnamed protein product [Rotaria magnacalcarata]|uniref:Uncharacterized protein n=1 Tax=Rotaria magnacalcarata TaxID=392030 RepID=A0A816ZFT0_9BILA|nr:unnamed protein product [Rotaria magnacalcarata]CAF2208934.1 unnamed protein product [Rotaria magnacalcarata]CAF4287182.1 unnamed protein product [Rotaria magnacalcarata]CAF4331199.1 unnamed protein product [Rotaria magnacalcarata]